MTALSARAALLDALAAAQPPEVREAMTEWVFTAHSMTAQKPSPRAIYRREKIMLGSEREKYEFWKLHPSPYYTQEARKDYIRQYLRFRQARKALKQRAHNLRPHEAKSLLLAALYEAQEPAPNWQAWMDQAARYGLSLEDAIRLAGYAAALSSMIYNKE